MSDLAAGELFVPAPIAGLPLRNWKFFPKATNKGFLFTLLLKIAVYVGAPLSYTRLLAPVKFGHCEGIAFEGHIELFVDTLGIQYGFPETAYSTLLRTRSMSACP